MRLLTYAMCLALLTGLPAAAAAAAAPKPLLEAQVHVRFGENRAAVGATVGEVVRVLREGEGTWVQVDADTWAYMLKVRNEKVQDSTTELVFATHPQVAGKALLVRIAKDGNALTAAETALLGVRFGEMVAALKAE